MSAFQYEVPTNKVFGDTGITQVSINPKILYGKRTISHKNFGRQWDCWGIIILREGGQLFTS